MKTYRHPLLSAFMILAVALGAGACEVADKIDKDQDSKEKRSDDDKDEEDEGEDEDADEDEKSSKKKKKKSAKSDKKSKDKKKKAKADEDDEEDEGSSKGGPDLDALLGSKADGFSPAVFVKLKAGMSPAQAAKIMPGGDKVDEFGFSEIRPKDAPGVHHYKLSYQDGKLTFAEIIFDESVSNDAFWEKLVAHLKKKLDPIEMKELGTSTKSVMWIGPTFNSITLGEGIVDPGFTLQYAVLE